MVESGLELCSGPAKYEVMVRDASTSLWHAVVLLGPMLDREAALAHPLIEEVFHMTDHAVLEDQPLKAYLDGLAV